VTEPSHRCMISPLSLVEMESVLAIKVRTGEINEPQVEVARRCMRADLSQRRLVIAPGMQAGHYHTARLLLVRYGAEEGLRTLDALQLAVALGLRRAGHISLLIAADQRLCRVAELAGCPAANPEKPGQVLA
jgi:hypothetical protein